MKMMKKMSVVIIAVTMLVVNLASAESFRLHSGTNFGMTMDEVRRIETNAGYEVQSKNGGFLGNSDNSNVVWFSAPNLAGIGGQVYYDFSATTGGVNECLYLLKGYSSNDFKILINSYIDKYGSPITQGDKFIDLPSEAHDAVDDVVEEIIHAKNISSKSQMMQMKVSKTELYQWLIPQDDGSTIDIILCEIKREESVSGYSLDPRYTTYISYSLRTAQEMQNVKDVSAEKEMARDADI